MPHSLRVRLKNLQRKGELTEKDIDRIFKALSQEPTDDKCHYCEHNFTPYKGNTGEFTEQEPCGDAVSREAILDTTICEGISCNECSFNEIDGESGCLLHARIDELPPVTPKQKSGKWLRVTDKAGHLVWECDKCGWQQRFNTNFCSDCGAKMESEE